jgi:hypothetical protein
MSGEPRPDSEPQTHPKRPGPALVARIIGALLCLSAGLKIFELFDYPRGGIGESLLLAASTVELLIGAALILRIWPRVFVPATTVLFIALAAMSVQGAARGIWRCGCLGPVPMPTWAMMIIDAAAAAALIWALLRSGRWRAQPVPTIAAAGLGAAIVGLMMGSMLYPRPLPITRYLSSQVIADSKTFTFHLKQFRGRPFYLNDFVRIDADLSRGKWKVILTRPRCPRCDRRLRSAGCRPEGDERVAIIQVGGEPDWTPPVECDAVLGHLSGDKTWVFEAPLIFRLADGIVTEAR